MKLFAVVKTEHDAGYVNLHEVVDLFEDRAHAQRACDALSKLGGDKFRGEHGSQLRVAQLSLGDAEWEETVAGVTKDLGLYMATQ